MYDENKQSGKTQMAVDPRSCKGGGFMETFLQIILLLVLLEILKTIKK